MPAANERERFPSAAGGHDEIALGAEDRAHGVEDRVVVVDDEHSRVRPLASLARRDVAVARPRPTLAISRPELQHQLSLLPSCSGSATWNVDPFPISLSAQMRPPCSSTMPRQIYNPRPMPWKRRSSTFDAREKRSNIFGRSVGGMPMP